MIKQSLRPSQGFLGTGEQGQFFQGNKGLKIRGTGEHRQFLGTGNIKNQDFVFREQENAIFFFEVTKKQVPRWGGPHHCTDRTKRYHAWIEEYKNYTYYTTLEIFVRISLRSSQVEYLFP